MKVKIQSVKAFFLKFKNFSEITVALAAVFFSISSVSGVAGAAEISKFEHDFYTIGQRTVREVADPGFAGSSEFHSLGAGNEGSWLGEVNEADLVLDQIINMGKKVWAIIEANKPVVNLQVDSASALPRGLQDWSTLANWRAPAYKTYRVTYDNLYGITVVDLTYRVVYSYGGSVNGKGAYLANVTVVPAELMVGWGYKFNLSVTVPSVTNAGTHESPLAAAQLQITWKVDTVLKHEETTNGYYVRGDGLFSVLD